MLSIYSANWFSALFILVRKNFYTMDIKVVFCVILLVVNGIIAGRWSDWTPATGCLEVAGSPCDIGIQTKVRTCLTNKCNGPSTLKFPCRLNEIDCKKSGKKLGREDRWTKVKQGNNLNLIGRKELPKTYLLRRRRQVLEYPVNPFLNSYYPLAQNVPLAAPMAAPLAGAAVAAAPMAAAYEPYPFAVPQVVAPYPLIYPSQTRQKRSVVKENNFLNYSSCSFEVHRLNCSPVSKNSSLFGEVKSEKPFGTINVKTIVVKQIFFKEILFQLTSIAGSTVPNNRSKVCDSKVIYDESLPLNQYQTSNKSKCFTKCLDGHVFYMVSKALYCGHNKTEEVIKIIEKLEDRLDQILQTFIIGRCAEARKCEVGSSSMKKLVINHNIAHLCLNSCGTNM
ncbi:hypothetical protein SNEBB_001208 [Seison nebaliae]|nr:hypothetical protein SNEBB_001208 [Seison nebaliae]